MNVGLAGRGNLVAGPRGGLALLLVALTSGTFLVSGSGAVRSPFLLEMARDLDTDLLAVANLVAIMAVTWGIVSLVAGAASDRIGRKPLLFAALVAVGASMVGIGLAPSYLSAVLWVLLGGVGGGGFMGLVFATVADHVPPGRRGGALGWAMTGQSLSLVVGVPLATLIGAQFGWRGAHVSHGIATLLVGVVVLALVPRRGQYQATAKEAAAAAPLQTILTPRILSLLASGTTERICFAAMSVYLPTFLIATYGISLSGLAVALLLVTLGNLCGNMTGGRIADGRVPRELIYAASLLATAATAVPLLVWTPGLEASIVLGFLSTFANAVGRPPLMAALSAVPEAVRGTVLGLNVTFASVGWISATAVGGWLVGQYGFGSLGLFCGGMALVGAGVLGTGMVVTARRARPLPADPGAPAPTG